MYNWEGWAGFSTRRESFWVKALVSYSWGAQYLRCPWPLLPNVTFGFQSTVLKNPCVWGLPREVRTEQSSGLNRSRDFSLGPPLSLWVTVRENGSVMLKYACLKNDRCHFKRTFKPRIKAFPTKHTITVHNQASRSRTRKESKGKKGLEEEPISGPSMWHYFVRPKHRMALF